MDFVFANNASSFLMLPILAADTEITINEADIDDFPDLGVDEQFAITLQHPTTGEREIMYVTAYDMYEPDVLTVVRAQEGTVAQDFPATTIVAHILSAGVLEYLRDLHTP